MGVRGEGSLARERPAWRFVPLQQRGGGDDSFGPIVDPERAKDREQVDFHRRLADVELTCDELVRLAVAQEAHDVDLPAGERQHFDAGCSLPAQVRATRVADSSIDV